MNLIIDKHGVSLNLSIWFVAIIALILLIYLIGFFQFGRMRVDKVDFSFAGMGTISISQNKDTVQLAHSAWIELTTRKAFLPFDEENDVLVEVYDSWYQLFIALRKIVQEVPPSKVSRPNSESALLTNAIVGALNLGLRPHLTRWQAKFRRWYSQAVSLDANSSRTPQEIQRDYPEYENLVADLKLASEGLAGYTESMRKISGSQKKWRWFHKNSSK